MHAFGNKDSPLKFSWKDHKDIAQLVALGGTDLESNSLTQRFFKASGDSLEENQEIE